MKLPRLDYIPLDCCAICLINLNNAFFLLTSIPYLCISSFYFAFSLAYFTNNIYVNVKKF